MHCQPLERCVSAQQWEGVVVNVSQKGLGLELTRRFEPGTTLTVRLGDRKQHQRWLLARVRWTKKKAEKLWQIGCQFDQPLTEQELGELR
jgi:hypothetical protein